jgi:uncharacterized membrane protein YbhN (UPF0104 family)
MKRLAKPGVLLLLLLLPVLAWWALQTLPFDAVWQLLSELHPLGLLGLFLLDGLIVLLFGSRSWIILRAFGSRVNALWLAAYRLSAFSVSYLTPGQQFGGEPLQVYWLNRRHQVAGATALTTVGLDKLFEVLSNFTFLMAGIFIVLRAGVFGGQAPLDPRAAIWLAGLFLLPVIYLLAIWSGRLPLSGLLGRLPRLGRLSASVTTAERQAADLLQRKPWTIAWLGLASGLTWVLMVAEYWLMVRLFGVELTLVQTILALTAARLAFLTPLPGGLGALEAGQVLAMQSIGLDPALGISVSLLIRARDLAFALTGMGIGARLSGQAKRLPVSSAAAD